MNGPNTSQCERDAIDDHEVVELADLVGYGPHAVTVIEAVAQ